MPGLGDQADFDRFINADTAKIIRTIVESLAEGNNVYFHCQAGYHRTGFISTILYSMLGASFDDIFKDYALSDFTGQSGLSVRSKYLRKWIKDKIKDGATMCSMFVELFTPYDSKFEELPTLMHKHMLNKDGYDCGADISTSIMTQADINDIIAILFGKEPEPYNAKETKVDTVNYDLEPFNYEET